MGKITMLAAGAAGYVLGARAGRDRYEQIVSQAQSVWGNPRVQARKDQAAGAVKETASDVAQQAAGAAKDAAQSAKDVAQDKAGSAKQAVQDARSSDEPAVPTPDVAFGGSETAAFPADPGQPGEPGRHV